MWTTTLTSPPSTGRPVLSLDPIVTCPSTQLCLVTGFYRIEGGAMRALLGQWQHSVWTLTQVGDLTPGDQEQQSLGAAVCPDPTICLAVGSRYLSSDWQPLSVPFVAGAWTALSVPLPEGQNFGLLGALD